MTSNSAEIVPQVQHDFQALVAYVSSANARAQTASTVALTLFRRLLALGAALLRRFFVTRAAGRPAGPVLAPDGTPLRDHGQRPTTDDSVFGKVRCGRHSFIAPGQVGIGPLDAELSLPARCSAALLCAWVADGTTDTSSRESQTVLERILGVSLRVQAMEASVADAAGEVTAFDDQPTAPPAPTPAATILVVQADGTGVPMVQPSPATPPARLGTGQKRGTTKAAVVTGLYTIAPSRRTPQKVAAALLPEPGRPEPSARPAPVEEDLHATLEGKAVAMLRLVQWVAEREGPHLHHRVALTDGAEALQAQVVTPLAGAYPGAGYHPPNRVSVGYRSRLAGGNPSPPHGVGAPLSGAPPGRPDGCRDRRLGRRGPRSHVDGNPTGSRMAHGRL